MPLLFLNEKSCGTDCDPSRADQAMTEFARTAVAVAKEDRVGTVLVSEVPLKELLIADGYHIGKWIGNPKHRDHWVRLRQMQGKSPFKAVFPDEEEPWDVEYRHEGANARGLGGAHLMGGLAVSLPVHTRWDATSLPLEREELVERADGTADSRLSRVEVRHAAAERHVVEHAAWIRASRDTAVRSGAELWTRRADLFPRLQFLPRVEGDLNELAVVSVALVRERLTGLEEAVADWDPAAQPVPQWRHEVNPEHSTRKRELCWFPDLDGVSRPFDLHAYFPPKPGRLHFRLVPEDRTVRIAYIGRKLGV